jgi:hypothetical protein
MSGAMRTTTITPARVPIMHRPSTIKRPVQILAPKLDAAAAFTGFFSPLFLFFRYLTSPWKVQNQTGGGVIASERTG